MTILVAGALVAGLTLGGLSIASAAGRTPRSASGSYATATTMGSTSPVAALSTLTGLSVQEIQTLRNQGQSLSAIAVDNGIDPAAVIDQAIAARQTYLDTLVAAGKMTAAQEQAALDKIRASVQLMMDAVPGTRSVPSAATTPSVPATGGAGMNYTGPRSRKGGRAPMKVDPGTAGGTSAPGACLDHVAPPATTTPAPETDQSPTTGQADGPAYSGGSGPGTMGSGSGGTGPRGSGSCGR